LLAVFFSFFVPINDVVLYFVAWNFFAIIFPGSLVPQEPRNIFCETCIACSSGVYRGGPLVGVTRKILMIGTKFNQTSMIGPLGGAVGISGSSHHQS
jgi:hypothetical protein